MGAYRHYSFDLWLTLIKSNPLFKQQRARIFHERYNTLGKPLAEVDYIFRQAGQMVTNINEATGKNIDAEEIYLMVISLINDGQINLPDIDMAALYQEMEALLLENMPVIYCERTADVLAFLKDEACTVSLLSNTGFIKGCTLRKVLAHLAIEEYFDFQLYSDEAGLSKPNPAFFQQMIDQALAVNDVSLSEIIHIGDNPRADVWGATRVGIGSLLVNSNQTSILTLKNHAPQNILTA